MRAEVLHAVETTAELRLGTRDSADRRKETPRERKEGSASAPPVPSAWQETSAPSSCRGVRNQIPLAVRHDVRDDSPKRQGRFVETSGTICANVRHKHPCGVGELVVPTGDFRRKDCLKYWQGVQNGRFRQIPACRRTAGYGRLFAFRRKMAGWPADGGATERNKKK